MSKIRISPLSGNGAPAGVSSQREVGKSYNADYITSVRHTALINKATFCAYCILCVLEIPISLFPLTVDEKSICDSHLWFSPTLNLANTIYRGSCFSCQLGSDTLGKFCSNYASPLNFFFLFLFFLSLGCIFACNKTHNERLQMLQQSR